MQRKDGLKKRRAKRNLPQYSCGMRDHQNRTDKNSLKKKPTETYTIVSMFSGCGGMDLGFVGNFNVYGITYAPRPFEILASYDNSQDAIETYQLNIDDKISELDLSNANPNDMPTADILLGGFPCQDFSSSGPKTGLSGERGKLYKALTRYMHCHRPKIVVGENVPHLGRLAGGAYLNHILNDFEAAGYSFEVWDIHCPSYGLPQSRRRLFLVGVRNDLSGFPIRPEPTHQSAYFAIDKALADLEDITDETITNQSQYFVASRATSGGGQGDHTNRRGEVSYCIRANARGRIQFHYNLDRRLTVRECARLQSFPDEYVFPYTTQRNLTLIGNAVPPIIGHAVAGSIQSFLQSGAEKRAGVMKRSHRTITPEQLEMIV